MKKILAILLFVFDIILGPIACIGMGGYLLIRYTFFNPIREHWYDGIVITGQYYKIIFNQMKNLYHNSYVIMRDKVRA